MGLFEIDVDYQQYIDDYKKYIDDYKRFCLKCSWNVINDLPEGCICPSGEEVWQCDMYRYYHPEEVKEFEKSMEDWTRRQDEYEQI